VLVLNIYNLYDMNYIMHF